MPIVPYKLDVGFRRPAWVPPPLANVPDEKAGGGLFQFGENWKHMQEDFAGLGETFGAAFQLENDVLNSWEFLTKPTFTPDPNFDLEANLKAANMWDDFRWNYVGVQSPGEFLYKTRQILKEKKAREILSAAGPDGVAAAIIAGAVSPTILLPLAGASKTIGRGLITGLAWGAAAGALQEVPLQLNQELRTLEESGISIGFSTIVGGVLGGGIGALNKGLEKLSADMGVAPGTSYVSPLAERALIEKRLKELDLEGKTATDLDPLIAEAMTLEARLKELDLDEARMVKEAEVDDAIAHSSVGTKSDLGADALDAGAGGLKKMLGIGERLTRIAGPVTSVLGQKISKQGQWMMAQLSTAGLRLEKNLILDSKGEIIGALPSTEGGGTVEGLIMSRRGDTLQQIDKAYDLYADYMLGKGQGVGPFRRQRAGLRGQFAGGEKLNRRQFFEAVGEAMWRGDVSPIPQVQQVAQSFRQYYDALLKEAQDLGIISDEIAEVAPDLSFLNRVYDTEAIKRNPQKFTKILADHFEQALKGDIERLHAAFVKSDQADRLRLADFDLPLEEAQKLRAQYLDELKAINELEDDPAALEQMISDLRGQMKKDTGERKKLEADMAKMTMLRDRAPLQRRVDEIALERERIHERIRELQQLGGDDLEQRTLRKRELKARIRNLNRSRYMVEEKARAKYDKMEDLEDQSIESLERVVRSGSNLLKKLDKSDESFGRELTGLQASVSKAGSSMQKLKDQVDALQEAASTAEAAVTVKLTRADLDNLQAVVDEADANLPPSAAEAVSGFVGHGPKSRDKSWTDSMGMMIPEKLEAAARGDAPDIADELEASFAPIREQIRQQTGDTITLYRVQDPVTPGGSVPVGFPKDGKRAVLSWTADEAFAKQHAGMTPPLRVYSNEEIANFERVYQETGEVKIGRHRLVNEGSEYPQLYAGNEHITDTDSVRSFAESENEWAAEFNVKQEEKAEKIVTASVPLNDVMWVTDRAGQAEFIVRNGPDRANFIDETGKLSKTNAPKSAESELQRLFKKEAQAQKAIERFNELFQELADFENINWVERGRAEARGVIQDALTESVTRLNAQLEKRYARIAKLEKQAEKFDAGGYAAKRKEIEDRIRARKEKYTEKRAALGDDDPNNLTGVADVRRHAEEIADLARTRIQGLNVRLAGFDAMSDARGTELARTLSVDSLKLANEGFLVSDAEHLLHTYANTLIPDIEIVRRFGAFAPDGERNLQFTKLNEEQFMVERAAKADLEAKAAKAGKPVDEKELGDLMHGIGKEYDTIRKNLDASIRRLRNQWVIASDPDSLATRMTQTILSMQALRFLGTVGLSSIPDIGRPVMRYGIGKTVRAAWIPLISNWKAIKMTADEARRAFVAVESATAHRAFQLSELMDFARRRTKVESTLQWTTSKVGIIAGFAPWTDLMKTLSSMTLNMKIMDSIDLSLNAVKTDAKRLEAVEFLNSLGMSQDYQKRIWDEMMNGGAERIKGVWVPQTERWTDKAAIRAYRAALYSEGAASIITPGLELPKIANASLPGKLFFNLKSFALASTSKTLMAGLQQRDAAVFNGVMVSMALGALSFYLKAVIAGGAAEQRMRNATPEQWVDEALDASGLLGVLSTVQRVAQDVPGVRNVASVSGVSSTIQGKPVGQTMRSSGAGLIEDVAGPTADLAFTAAQIITGLDKPTRAQVHRIRQLLPFQNVFYLRRLFDQVENIVGDAAHLKGQSR